ncbi:MAG: hypothetical protein IE917_20770, partial [Betaproteobacteria bacterium]|nr:hypothetical protein [Betaproteobacteria bacterium]
MISFDRSFLRAPRRAGSHVALALALASGAVLAGGVVAAPAYAKKKEEAAPKTNYSKGFVAAYKPVADKVNSDKADLPALKGELETVKAAVETDDDKMAAGQLIYNYGLKTTEIPVQREGMDMMLASGKVAPASLGQYQYVAGQLAYQEKDYPKARELVQAAIASGYTQNDPEAMVAESYFNDNQEAAGLEYLAGVITARDAAGQEVPVTWVKRGLTVAYQGNNGVEARRFSMLLIKHDPTANSWSDAIAIERSFFDYDDQQQLDLLRLARLTDGLRSERDYVDYLSAADARRLPGEVKEVADAGIAAGKLNANDVFVKEAVG